MNKLAIILSAFIIGFGIWSAGFSIGKGIYQIRKLNRTVTVKGLAEQDVISDLGIWEINYREVGTNLVELDNRLQQDRTVVTNFLKQQGFDDKEIELTPLKVEDRFANVYNQTSNQQANEQRYVVTGGLRIRSQKVYQIRKSLQLTNQLLQQGLPLAFESSSLSPNPSYFYTQLDKIRPAMLAEATKSARVIAQQFAKDSETQLSGIQRASQGVFQIMGRDTSTMSSDWNSNQNAMGSIEKKVRLVTTIDYRLK